MSSQTERSVIAASLFLSVGLGSALIVTGAWMPILLATFGWYIAVAIIKAVATKD